MSNTPQHDRLHARLAAVCGGASAIAVSSGMAAIATALCEVVPSGGRVVASTTLYGGSLAFLGNEFVERGASVEFVDATDADAMRAALTLETDAIYLEPLSNPLLDVADLEAAIELAASVGARVVVDNTFLSPFNVRPLEMGADVVVHSASKYMAGHTDVIGGVIATRDAELGLAMRKRAYRTGHHLDPQAMFLLERGLKTLGVRLERQNASALALARALSEDARIADVTYPGLPSHEGHARIARWSRGGGGLVSVRLSDEVDPDAFVRGLEYMAFAPSLGGVESLVTMPWRTTHASVPPERRRALGIDERTIRFSVGLEDIDDLIEDVRGALERASQ